MTRDDLAGRIRSEAAIADRPGQMDRLEQIADEVATLRAKVEALQAEYENAADADHAYYALRDVLALLDGGDV